MMPAPSPLLRSSRTTLLYVVTLLREFRWSLVVLGAALLVATIAFYLTPDEFAQAQRPDNLLNAVYAAWMAMLVQPVNSVGTAWYISIIYGLYPVIGLIVVGEGIVRLALLIFSKRHGQKEWMRVMAATYRDHVVLCGVGHLGGFGCWRSCCRRESGWWRSSATAVDNSSSRPSAPARP